MTSGALLQKVTLQSTANPEGIASDSASAGFWCCLFRANRLSHNDLRTLEDGNMMTANDFTAIALAIAVEVEKPAETVNELAKRKIVAFNIATNIADVAAQANPRFDRQRFLNACGFAHTK